ncbi:MAG: hypothetical protein PHH23_06660 [Paludibacteraceae bacterium]|nr:hypothetical protein [Paludibacteraceae bacterium]
MSKAKFDSILGKMRKADSLTYPNGAMVIDVGSTCGAIKSPDGTAYIELNDYDPYHAKDNLYARAYAKIVLNSDEGVTITGDLRGSSATFRGNLNANKATIANEVNSPIGAFSEAVVTDNLFSYANTNTYLSYNARLDHLSTRNLTTTDWVCTDIIYNSFLNDFIHYDPIRDVAYFCNSLSKLTLDQNLAELFGGNSFVIRTNGGSIEDSDRIYCDVSQFLIHHYGQDIVKTERVYDDAYLNIDFAGILKKEYDIFYPAGNPESAIYLKDGTRTLIKATHSINDVPVTYFGADGSAVISMYENGVSISGYGSKPMLTQNTDELLIASGFGSVKIGNSTTPNIDAIYLSATGIAQLKTLLGIN